MSKDYLPREAALKRLDGYQTGAKRQEVLADCAARVERAIR